VLPPLDRDAADVAPSTKQGGQRTWQAVVQAGTFVPLPPAKGGLASVRVLGDPLTTCSSIQAVEARNDEVIQRKRDRGGVLFILCSAAAILSIVPLGATAGVPVDFAKLAGK
jgi:hypothetical protein